MSGNTRVLNVTRGYSIKHKAALKAVENCACVWVEFGVSVRDLTLAESIAARNEQAARREPLAFAELPGVVFEQPASAVSTMFERMSLVRAANELVFG